MNCQECRSLVERFLDNALTGFTRRKVNLHLSRCADCRGYFDRRRQNQALAYRAMNDALAGELLPDDFAGRFLAAHIVPERRFQMLRFGRLWKVAAALAAMVSFVGFAAVVIAERHSVDLKDADVAYPQTADAAKGREGTEDVSPDLFNSYVPSAPSISYISSTDTPKGEIDMTMRKSATVALSAALAAAPLAAGAGEVGYTSASYVQDGLIAQWDGIDNAGTGTHDSDATVWKDLVGECDMTLTANGHWANGNALSVTNAGAVGTGAAPAYKTIEIVYKMTDKNGRILFASGHAAANGKLAQLVCFSAISGNSLAGFFDGTGTSSTRYARYNFDATTVCSMSAVHEDGVVSTVYLNGIIDMYQKLDTNWGLGDGKIMVGDRASSGSGYGWTGEVYAIRLYSTVLTKEQVAANLAVDAARFGVYEYKYVASGDPVATATAKSCAVAEATPSAAIEARYCTHEWSDGIALDATDTRFGMILQIR